MANEELDVLVRLSTSGKQDIRNAIGALTQLDRVGERVDPIDIDVKVESALDEIGQLMAELRTAESLSKIDAAVSTDVEARREGVMPLPTRRQFHGLQSQVGVLIEKFDSISFGAGLTDEDREADSFLRNLRQGSLRMSDLHNILARLVPLLVTFVAALPALIAGVVALAGAAASAAAALGAIGLFGAIGFAQQLGDGNLTQGFQELVTELKDIFLSELAPLFEAMAPIFEDSLDGLRQFLDAVADRRGALVSFADEAGQFGQFVIDFVPDALASMARLAEATAPVFGMLADFFQSFSLSEAFANTLARTLPELRKFAITALEALPVIIRMSAGFLDVASSLVLLVTGIGRLLSIIPITDEALGVLIGSVLTLTTAWLVLSSVLRAQAIISLGRYITSLLSVSALQSVAATTSSILSGALTKLGISASISAGAVSTLTAAIVGLLSVTLVGLVVAAIGSIAAKALTAGSNIKGMTDELREFKSVSDSLNTDSPFGAPDPNVRRGFASATGGSGRGTTINVEGRTDDQTMRDTTRHAFGASAGGGS